MQHIFSFKDSKSLIIANISAEEKSFHHSSNALDFVADISKLKRIQNCSEGFRKAIESAKKLDEIQSAKTKHWKSQAEKANIQDVRYF
jgi:hypothetical protein